MVKKSKIPVRIDWIKDDSGKYETQIVMDSTDFFSSDTKIREKILKFKIKYIENVKKVQKIFYGKNFDEKKYRDLSSLTYFKIGLILKKFNKHIQNEFEITNYNQAISRDFGLSPDYISDIITIAEVFKKNEIIDSIPFSYYRALKRKRIELIELGLFEKEKKRLNKMANDEKLLGRENYKKELNVLLTSNNKKRKQK